MSWVYRAAYMERLFSLEGTRDIKVITGMRRSGKSELMKTFAKTFWPIGSYFLRANSSSASIR